MTLLFMSQVRFAQPLQDDLQHADENDHFTQLWQPDLKNREPAGAHSKNTQKGLNLGFKKNAVACRFEKNTLFALNGLRPDLLETES